MLRSFSMLLLVAALLPSGAAADTTIDLGNGHSASVDAKGVVRILKGQAPVVREMFIGTWVDGQFSDQMKAMRLEGTTLNGMLVRRGVIPRKGANERYQMFVRATDPDKNGNRDLLVTCIVDVASFPKAKAALLVRLPVAPFTGKSVFVKQIASGVFPAKQGPKPTLVLARNAHDLLIKDGDRPALFIGREDPGEILVQDSRKWGANAYEAQFHLMPSRSQPPTRRVLHLVVSLAGARRPTIARVSTDRPPVKKDGPAGVPRYERIEFRTDLWARYKNPYDRAHIAVTALVAQPDKTLKRIPGFLYQDFERSMEAGREKLTPVGPHQWRARFTPTQLGKHAFRIEVKTARGTTTTEPQVFHATKSTHPGFIGIHKKNRKFFQFSNGKTYFGVGHNVCWGSEERLSYDYDDFFRRMGNAGLNYTRVWMCSWDTGIEGSKLDSYRLDAAWRLDYILRLAEQRGIYIKLCFDNEHDYQTPAKRKHFGIWKQNGGPCTKVLDFFTIPASKKAYKRRLDYIIARWGYSPHIMAWELWNEMNYIAASDRKVGGTPGVDKDHSSLSVSKVRGILTDWTQEMAAYLKDNDPNRHLVTTSLGLHVVWDQIWELEDIDFTAIHAYLPNPRTVKDDKDKDAVLIALRAGDRIAKFDKPYHVSEFGGLEYENKANVINQKDRNGIHLRNAIWGGLFSGAAITPSNWWWKEYIHDRNLYTHYSSAARFLHGIDMADTNWTRIAAAGTTKVRILGIKKSDACAMWIQQRGNDWYRRLMLEKPLEPLNKVKVRVPNIEKGKYIVTWWDTTAGKITHYAQLAKLRRGTANTYDLILEYTTGRSDIAVKVIKAKD
jgi:hypothetical protein